MPSDESQVVTDTDEIVVAGSEFVLVPTFTKDGAVYNLTGKTVRITIRAEASPDAVVNAALEDMSVTLTSPTTGVGQVTVSTTDSGYLAPRIEGAAWRTVAYLVQGKVVEDNYQTTTLLRFKARRKLD